DGFIKVLDFGLAKLSMKMSASNTSAPTAVQIDTNPGTIMGTAAYMSPEQARGLELDARTDIFSFGVLLYEIVAGQPPFDGPSYGDLIASILTQEPQPL